MRDGYMRGALSPRRRNARWTCWRRTSPPADPSRGLPASSASGRSTVKRHLADLRARSGLTTEQLIYGGRAEGWLVVPSLEPQWPLGLLGFGGAGGTRRTGPRRGAAARPKRPNLTSRA